MHYHYFILIIEKSECAFVGTFNHFYNGTNLENKRWIGLTESCILDFHKFPLS